MEQKTKSCYHCSDREVGCHALCPYYKKRSAENEKRKAEEREKYVMDNIIYEMSKDAAKKRKRRINVK